MRSLTELLLERDPFQAPPVPEDRNDPAAIAARFAWMARGYAEKAPALVAWVQQGNKLPACYR